MFCKYRCLIFDVEAADPVGFSGDGACVLLQGGREGRNVIWKFFLDCSVLSGTVAVAFFKVNPPIGGVTSQERFGALLSWPGWKRPS